MGATMLSALISRIGKPREVAERLGVDRVTVYRWISGERFPSVVKLERLFVAAGASEQERSTVISHRAALSLSPRDAADPIPTPRGAA